MGVMGYQIFLGSMKKRRQENWIISYKNTIADWDHDGRISELLSGKQILKIQTNHTNIQFLGTLAYQASVAWKEMQCLALK